MRGKMPRIKEHRDIERYASLLRKIITFIPINNKHNKKINRFKEH